MAINTGLGKVMRTLNKEIKRIEGATYAGLLDGVIEIRRDMDKTAPMIPVGKTGNLRSSWTVTTIRKGKNPIITAGFTADYAPYVHEMEGAHFQREDAGAKFYEASINRNKGKFLAILRRRSKIK